MYLEKLEIQGFKSFAKPAAFIFNRELTTIVGPNGSGKSNIADAIRWVLGEQSTKTLRGKKSEDVIFSGSDKKGKLGFAQVDLYLNNKSGLVDIEYEQIIITRRINRQGEGEYLINNNKVRLLDVQMLLAKANFGQKTYSVIGQGMITTILVSSAAERKEFFDEATGVKQFQIKKQQSENKLIHAKENIEQTRSVLNELTPRLRGLTRQVNKLEKREKISKELKELQSKYYGHLVNNLETKLGDNREINNKLEKEVSDLNQKLINLQTILEKEENHSSRQDSFQEINNKLKTEQDKLNYLLKEKTVLDGQIELNLLAAGKTEAVWNKNRKEFLEKELAKETVGRDHNNREAEKTNKELRVLREKQNTIKEGFQKIEKDLVDNKNKETITASLFSDFDILYNKQKELEVEINNIDKTDNFTNIKNIANKLFEEIKSIWQKIKKIKSQSKSNIQKDFNQVLKDKENILIEINKAENKIAIINNNLKQINININKNKEELIKIENKTDFDKINNKDDLIKKLKQLDENILEQNIIVKRKEEEIADFNKEEESKKQSLVKSQKEFRQFQAEFNIKNNKLNEIKIILARLETKYEDLNKEMRDDASNIKLNKDIKEINLEETKEKILNLKKQLNIIGGIDEEVIKEYKEVKERHNFLDKQINDLEKAIKQLEKIIKDLEETISTQFDKAFKGINKLFNKYFQKLFKGGQAELILDIKEAQSEEDNKAKKQYGIEIKALPPGKKLANVNMLSGGEKALTSIALISAIIANNPSPFVVLDEVDAALDEANSIRFAEILAELSDKTQFVAITHNRATMQESKIIYGITMGDDGVSSLLSMNFDEADKIAS